MKLTQTSVLAVLLAAASASAIPAQKLKNIVNGTAETEVVDTTSLHFYNGTCNAQNIRVRKEWRNLSVSEKKAYLKAEQCLLASPAGTTLSGVTSRFSDLQSLHRDRTNITINGDFVQDIIHEVVSSPP